MIGWTKSHRSILNHPLLQKFDERGLWETLQLKASHKRTRVALRGMPITLERGQVAISVVAEAEAGGITRKRMRVILGKWVDDGMIKVGQAKGHAFTIITICNYDKYQAVVDDEGPSLGPDKGQDGARMGPTEQEPKNHKKIESIGQQPADLGDLPAADNVFQLRPAAKKPEPDATFDAWWAQYPRKVAKGAARRAYVARIRAKITPDALLEGLQRSKAQWVKEKRDTTHLPHGATWLGAEGWADQYEPAGNPDDLRRQRLLDLVRG